MEAIACVPASTINDPLFREALRVLGAKMTAAADRIEELERDLHSEMTAKLAYAVAAQVKIRELTADAERYRWLRGRPAQGVLMIAWGSKAACSVERGSDTTPQYVDRCVDAARADPLVDVHSDSVQSAATNSEPRR